MAKFLNFFWGIIPLKKFLDETHSYTSKPRPVYSKFLTNPDIPQEKPKGCLPVLLKYVDGQFVSPSTDFEPIPFSDEESKRKFREKYFTDFGKGSEFDFSEDQWYYFFFKPEEINTAGVEIDRKPGCNHWNMKKMRYEPQGFVINSSLEYERYYAISKGFYPICFQFNFQTETFSSPNAPSLSTFTIEEMTSSWCFSRHFKKHKSIFNWDEYTFVIYFTLRELQDARIDVPEDPITGFRYRSYKHRLFKEVEKPRSSCGWDEITRRFMPLCECEECVLEPGKFAFDWRRDAKWLGNPVYSHHVRTDSDQILLHDKRYMDRLFSIYGGPYCSNNCYCYTCERHQPPSNFEKEDECNFCCKVSPGSDSSDDD
jgi:hypothetical protein